MGENVDGCARRGREEGGTEKRGQEHKKIGKREKLRGYMGGEEEEVMGLV